jgi:predicted Zn-dependent protease with MMP-like domain
VEGVEFVIVREPHNAEDQEMLGVFEGASLMDDGADCPRITIFYMNVWRYARYRLHRYRREVERTVYHEVGHFLGWDEEDLRKRDLD